MKKNKTKPNNNKIKKTKNNFYASSVVAHIFKSQHSEFRGRQVSEFKSSLTYIVNSRLARDTFEILSQNRLKTGKQGDAADTP